MILCMIRRYVHRLLGPLLLAVFMASSIAGQAQRSHPLIQRAPEVASYRLDVRLDPAAKTVSGSGRLTYRNGSPDTLDDLWLRLYLKAFSSPDTLWMRESEGGHRGFAADPALLGDITVEMLALADGTDLLRTATITDTLMRVLLPRPLEPDMALELDVRWTSKLPRVFARTGYGGRDDTFFMVGQWYPKFSVYQDGRWYTQPWHANEEFFHDFGRYDIAVTAPAEYIVAGAGVPTGEASTQGNTRTWRFAATDITDFAFAASPDFKIESAKAAGADIVLYYLPEHAGLVDTYMDSATGSLMAFSDWYGAYPHPRLTVVDVPDDAAGAGGMEYPTLITGGTLGIPSWGDGVALVVSHEVAHQWWPMQTATNEAEEPWLDEGLTEYSGMRYMQTASERLGPGQASIDMASYERTQYSAEASVPATLPARDYDGLAYGSAVYSKPAVGLATLEQVVGTEQLRAALKTYLAAFRFQHPTAADFRASLERSLDQDVAWFFDDFLATGGEIDYAVGEIRQSDAGTEIRIAREGAVPAPVEVRVTHASGKQSVRTWDGSEPELVFNAADTADRAVSVELDPEHKLVAELDRRDNGRYLRADWKAGAVLSGRLAFWMQMLGQMLGMGG
jgi:hypothetical protein